MVPLDKLAQITRRFEFLEAKLSAGASPSEIADLSREYSDLKPVAQEIDAYRRALDDLAEAEAMLADPEMRELAEEELPKLKARIPEMEQALRLALLAERCRRCTACHSGNPARHWGGRGGAVRGRSACACISAIARAQGWTFDILELQESDLGGIRDVVVHIKGEGVFARLKYESGVHRVQRVPETEGAGARPYLGRDRGGVARGGRGGYRHPRHRHPDRHDARLRGRRPACEHHGFGGAHHPFADRDHRYQFGEIAAPQPRDRDAGAARAAV